MVWYFIGAYTIKRTLQRREISYLQEATCSKNTSTLEEKFRIYAQPCNIPYVFT